MIGGAMVEDVIIIAGLLLLQCVYAGNSFLLSYMMSLGFHPFSVTSFFSFATFVVISPAAACHERKKWPKEFNLKLLVQVVLISFNGVLLFQMLYLEGLKQTSPAIATAMPNLAPGFIFLIAWAFGFEKLDLRCVHSKVKIIGTILCVIGAVVMSIMHSTASSEHPPAATASADIAFDKEKIIGCSYLVSAIFVLACNVVLQAATMADFNAPLSLCAVTSLIGSVLAVIVQFFQEGTQLMPVMENSKLLGYFILGGTIGGLVISFHSWALNKKGPVFVSIFSPVATVLSVIFSSVTLGDTLNMGSIGGMLFMFLGLYLVLWAQVKETRPARDGYDLKYDANTQKPLLSEA